MQITRGLLMSMAIRYDHALGVPGYYDQFGPGEHEKRLRTALRQMEQVLEEAVGLGYWSQENDEGYAAMVPEDFITREEMLNNALK